ncbi:MBL fold metallo-hydrolase [Kiloniella majae]|uniref:MBL fold metallo-hydrolase n=1 Tax=Kiloniella majae TaxID=1938558 RepID=UPI000A278E82|nr:MBL fold metallo-hydrolase [Kiloniella majae]
MDRRKFLRSSLLAIPATALPLSQAQTSSLPSQQNKTNTYPDLKVSWLGSAMLLIQFNGFNILTDPCLGGGENAFIMGNPNEMFDLSKGPNIIQHKRISPAPKLGETAIHQIILSHGHEDHFDQKAQEDLDKSIPFILPPHDLERIKNAGFRQPETLDWGAHKTIQLQNSSIKITAMPAYHSENPEIAKILGKGNGYYFEFSQGNWQRNIYWAGDTFGTTKVIEALKAFKKPDLMIPHMGGVGTTGPLGKISMEAEDLIPFVEKIEPKKVLPIHHSTYELYLEKISQLALKNDEQLFDLDLLSEGSVLSLT